MSFESLFGYYSRAQGSYAVKQITAPVPHQRDRSLTYSVLSKDYNGPHNFIKSLNESVSLHMARRLPVLYQNYQKNGALPNEFIGLLTMLPERVLAAQCTCALVDAKQLLTSWELFGLYSMMQYMETLLCVSDTIYNAVSAREWLIRTFYEAMLKDKSEYGWRLITHAKGKSIRSCIAVLHNSDVKVYNNDEIIISGPLIYSSDMKDGAFAVHDTNSGEDIRLSMVTDDGKKVTESLASFMKNQKDINVIIWSCKSLTKCTMNPQWYDILGRMFVGYDASWLQAIFTMPNIPDEIFAAIDTVAGFYGRSFFPLKAAIWWLVESANDPGTAFGQINCTAMRYIDRYFRTHGSSAVTRLIEKMVNTVESIPEENRSNMDYVGSVIYTFWTELQTPLFPKSIYEALRFIFIATFKKYGSMCSDPYVGIGMVFLSKFVIQSIVETPQKEKSIRSCLILATKSISQSINPPDDRGREQDALVATGRQYLSQFLQICATQFKGKMEVSLEPSIEEFTDAVSLMHKFTVENDTKIRASVKHDHWKWKLAEEIMFSIYLQRNEIATAKL